MRHLEWALNVHEKFIEVAVVLFDEGLEYVHGTFQTDVESLGTPRGDSEASSEASRWFAGVRGLKAS